MRVADHRRLGDVFVGDQRRFDLGGAEPMARDVQHVVHPAGDPVIAVLVAAAAVAGEIEALVGREIGLHEALVIAVDGAHLARPRVGQDQVAAAGALDELAVAVDQRRPDAEEGLGRRSRLERRRAGQRRDQRRAGLGLPPGVDDRAAALADHAIVPFPGLGVDRLADRAEEVERLPRGLLHGLVAGAHQRTDRRGCRVEDIDLMLVADFPEAAGGRVVGHAFEHQRRRAVGERPVDDVGVPGDPADVGAAPVHIAVVVVEDVVVGDRGVDKVAAGGVEDALRLAGRAGGVEHEQRVLGAHLLGRAVGRDPGRRLVVPEIAAGTHGDVAAGAAHDQRLDAVAGLCQGLVGVLLERYLPAAAEPLVGGDHQLRAAILDPAGQAVGREAAEDDGMDGADPGAGEHRHGRLGDHRHVDCDAVAALDAELLQDVGEDADVVMEFAIGDVARLARVVAFPDDGRLVAAGGQMAVEAIGGDVEGPVLVPLDRDVRSEAGVLDPGEGLDPVDPFRLLAPEAVGIAHRTRIHLLVCRSVDIGALRPLGRNRIDLLGHDTSRQSLPASRRDLS